MHKFAAEKAVNGYGLWVHFSDNAELLGLHIFSNKEDMIKFIEQNLV